VQETNVSEVKETNVSGKRVRLLVQVFGRLLAEEAGHRVRSGVGKEADWQVEQWRPAAVRQAFEQMGPFYIKVGQILSTRPDLVSEPIREELGKLHDRIAPTPFAEFEPVLADDLGRDWRRHFRDIDTTRPLGAASLAQVYRATLADLTPAVVKIQRPGVQSIVLRDMAVLRRAARIVAKRAPRFNSVFESEAMLAVVFDAMRPELDFVAEAGNMDQAREVVEQFDSLSVPEVISATPRVLVQSLAAGQSIRDAKREDFAEDERAAIGRDLIALMYRGYFIDRSFHADPHPGNIFVQPGERASLIDWGMVGQIDRRMSIALMMLLLNLVRNDGPGMARAWIEMGHTTPRADLAGFAADMAALVPRVHSASLQELNFGTVLGKVLRHSSRRGIATSPMVSILAKSFANMEGSVRYLAPELSVTDVFQDELLDIMIDLVRDMLSQAQVASSALELMYGATTGLEHIRQLLRDLANREFTVQVARVQGGRVGIFDPVKAARPAVLADAAALLRYLRNSRRQGRYQPPPRTRSDA
jgi:ubiquinone biosynthesis protein